MKSKDIVDSINKSIENFENSASNVYFIERTRKHKIQEKFEIARSEALGEFVPEIKDDALDMLNSVNEVIGSRTNIRSFYDDLGPNQIGYLDAEKSEILSTVIGDIFDKKFTELKSFKTREKFHSYGYHFSFSDEDDDIIIFSYIVPNSLLKRKKKMGIVFQDGLIALTGEILVVEKQVDCIYLKRHNCFLVKHRKRFENIFGLHEYNVNQTQKQLNRFKKSKQIIIPDSIEKEILKDIQLTSQITRMAKNDQFEKPLKYYEDLVGKFDQIRATYGMNDEVCDLIIQDGSVVGDTLCRVHTFLSASNRDFGRDLLDESIVFKILGGKEKITQS